MKSYDPKQEWKHIKCDLNKYTSNGSKGYALVVDLEYPKELWGFHDYCPLAPDKREIKREMLSNYQLKIADLYNIPIGNIKKLVPKLFDKEKYVIHYENTHLIEARIKTNKNTLCIRIQSISMAKATCRVQHTKRIEAQKHGDKDGKMYKLVKNAVYRKTRENLRNRIDVKLLSNKKDYSNQEYSKKTSKPSYMSHKIFGNDLVVICKNQVKLTLNKPAYIEISILEIRKVLKDVSATFVLFWFLVLNGSTCQTRKNVSLFHFKSSFISQENQILEFYIFKFHDINKCLSIKQEIHFTE